MFLVLALGLAIAASGFLLVYLSYFILVLRTSRKSEFNERLSEIIAAPIAPEKLPKVTVLVPAYDEEQIIYAKMKNISEFDYPHDRLEVFVLDDCSTDKTGEISEKGLKDFHLEGKILRNETRMGVNASYNRALEHVESDYILTTDADAVIPPKSLLKATKVLLSLEDVGGVAARMVPVHNKNTATTRTAIAYSDSYNSMLSAESALFSTFPGSTSCMLMKKVAFSPISVAYGSSDGNISLGILRNGFKFIFASQIEYYEPITESLREQQRQKIRRAARLIQSTLLNRELLLNGKYGSFGRTVFPLRFSMMAICPTLLLSSAILFLICAYLASPYIFGFFAISGGLVLLLGATTNIKVFSLVTSFLVHQIYLLVGLFSAHRKMSVWKKLERDTVHT